MSIKFSQFVTLCSEAYDADLMRSSTIRRQRDTAARRLTPAEIKRTKTEVNPETGERKQVPVVQKTRKDAGQARPQSTRSAQQQQPTKERGSAEVKQSYAEKEKERRRAAKARAAAKSGGAKPQSSASSSKDLSKQADKLLAKKKEEKPTTTKRSYKQRTEKGSNITTKDKKAAGDSQRNKARGKSQQEIKKQMIADYTEKHGAPPKGKAKMLITRDAAAAAKALN